MRDTELIKAKDYKINEIKNSFCAKGDIKYLAK